MDEKIFVQSKFQILKRINWFKTQDYSRRIFLNVAIILSVNSFSLKNRKRKFCNWYLCKEVINITSGKELTNLQKELVVKLWKEGKSYGKISDSLNILFSRISSLIARCKKRKTVENQRRAGVPWKISSRPSRKLMRQIKQNPMVTLGELQDDLLLSGICVTKWTISNEIYRNISKVMLPSENCYWKDTEMPGWNSFVNII